MTLPLPNLDTRRWADLVEEGRALIPRTAGRWTDHNIHDPGITLIELFAWVIEASIYRANRVPERHLRKFLALAGFPPAPARPARVVLAIRPPAGAGDVELPAGTRFAPEGAGAAPVRTLAAAMLVEAELRSLHVFDGERLGSWTRQLREGIAVPLFGPDPRLPKPYDAEAAPAIYLGFDRPLPRGQPVALFFRLRGDRPGDRDRLAAEAAAIAAECADEPRPCVPCPPPLDPWCEDAVEGGGNGPEGRGRGPGAARHRGAPDHTLHHSVRLVWEYRAAGGWRPLSAAAGQVEDGTRAFTLDGIVRLRVPETLRGLSLGDDPAERFYVRCRLGAGAFDAAPEADVIAPNAVAAEQSIPVWRSFPIAPGVVPPAPPAVGAESRLALRLDADGVVQELAPGGGDDPNVVVLGYQPATAAAVGRIDLTLALLDVATGLPEQETTLPDAPVDAGSVALWTLEGAPGAPRARRWRLRTDLDASERTDAHVVLDPTTGRATFGDGILGFPPPAGAPVIGHWNATRGAAGNSPAGLRWRAIDDVPNRALLGAGFATVAAAAATNPVNATGGADAEGVGAAAARAAASLWAHERLVELAEREEAATLDAIEPSRVLERAAPARAANGLDFERLALDVPGTRVARARAWAGLDPRLGCLRAPGTVTVIVVPELPRGRPRPSAGLLRFVRAYLDRRRALGTRLVVAGPGYMTVSVRATVRARATAQPERVAERVRAALRAFLDPLAGGPAGLGWPFGRDVYHNEVLARIDGVDGVDHVIDLALSADRAEATCSNVCVPPTALVASGTHEIWVLRP